jgi:hypothetical protein
MAELGATGTPIFSGFLRELGEYNPDLAWPNAYMVYERMRRSDAQVAATLWASKLPIRGGEWKIDAPEKPSGIEQEAADFVEQELFDGEIDFDAALENALLMFDFGASMHEDVYYIDGNRVRLKKLAARLPLTWYRWLVRPGTDELETIEQLGYRAGQYIRTDVPLNKSTLFVFRQEGANFTGRALLREMYQHWYIKSNLYKIDAIACERNGMGVPVIEMGPDAKREDRETALGWVTSLAANERTGLLLPLGWKFALHGVNGTLHEAKESIQHHGTMITVVGLAQFMMMGQSGHGSGNRSLGETMSDFFFMGLQASADLIAKRFTQTTIKRLVDFNFPGIEAGRYPKLTPQRIMALKFDAIVDALGKLGQGQILTPTPELEAWIRGEMGAPEADKAVIVRERAARTVSLPGADKTGGQGPRAGGQGGAAGGEGGSGGEKGDAAGGAENAKLGANSGAGADGLLVAYSEDQPRDDAGRWTAEVAELHRLKDWHDRWKEGVNSANDRYVKAMLEHGAGPQKDAALAKLRAAAAKAARAKDKLEQHRDKLFLLRHPEGTAKAGKVTVTRPSMYRERPVSEEEEKWARADMQKRGMRDYATAPLHPESVQWARAVIKATETDLSPEVGGGVLGGDAVPVLARAARGPEKWLAAAEIISALDKGRDDVAAALRRARGRVQAEIVNKLVNTPVRNLHRVSIAADEKLIAEVEEILRGIAEFGQKQVGDERARQLAGRKPRTAEEARAAVVAAERRDQVGLYADAVVSKFENHLTARAANVAANRMRNTGSATKGEVIQGIGSDLDEQSDKWIDGVAGEGANEAFAEGRDAGYEQYKDEIASCYYSALLDINTCETCAGADGQTAETPDELPDTPNADCDGGDKCRCVIVYVFADEGSKTSE